MKHMMNGCVVGTLAIVMGLSAQLRADFDKDSLERQDVVIYEELPENQLISLPKMQEATSSSSAAEEEEAESLFSIEALEENTSEALSSSEEEEEQEVVIHEELPESTLISLPKVKDKEDEEVSSIQLDPKAFEPNSDIGEIIDELTEAVRNRLHSVLHIEGDVPSEVMDTLYKNLGSDYTSFYYFKEAKASSFPKQHLIGVKEETTDII